MSQYPNARDLEILHHVARYRLTTREMLQRLYFSDATSSAVSKVTARHTGNRWLRECKLAAGFSYFVLGRSAASFIRIEASPHRRFTEQSFPLAYGYLAFCVTNNFSRLTSSEFAQQFPELCRPRKQHGGYYIDDRQQPCRLGTVLLDRGNPPQNVLRKLNRLLRQRYKIPAFATLIQNGWFSVTILTAWPLKQEYLQAAIRQSCRTPASIEVVTVPELQPFCRRI